MQFNCYRVQNNSLEQVLVHTLMHVGTDPRTWPTSQTYLRSAVGMREYSTIYVDLIQPYVCAKQTPPAKTQSR